MNFDELFDNKKTFTFEELETIENQDILITVIKSQTVSNLKKILKSVGIKGYSKLKKKEVAKLVYELINPTIEQQEFYIDDLIKNVNKEMNNEINQRLLPLPIEYQPTKQIPSYFKDNKEFYEEYWCEIFNPEIAKLEEVYFHDVRMNVYEFERRYKYLCKVLHPDKGGNKEEFIEMQKEYWYLSSKCYRINERYNKKIKGRDCKEYLEERNYILTEINPTTQSVGAWIKGYEAERNLFDKKIKI